MHRVSCLRVRTHIRDDQSGTPYSEQRALVRSAEYGFTGARGGDVYTAHESRDVARGRGPRHPPPRASSVSSSRVRSKPVPRAPCGGWSGRAHDRDSRHAGPYVRTSAHTHARHRHRCLRRQETRGARSLSSGPLSPHCQHNSRAGARPPARISANRPALLCAVVTVASSCMGAHLMYCWLGAFVGEGGCQDDKWASGMGPMRVGAVPPRCGIEMLLGCARRS